MDALFARIQFFVRPSGKLLRCPKGSNQSSIKTVNQPGSCSEENVSEELQAGNSAEFSKPQIPLPDRQFESVPLRQLVCCFCRRILLSGISANYPGVSLREFATTDSGEPNLGSPTGCSKQFSQVATPVVRFFPMRIRGQGIPPSARTHSCLAQKIVRGTYRLKDGAEL